MKERVQLDEEIVGVQIVDDDRALQELVAYVANEPALVVAVATDLAKLKSMTKYREQWKQLNDFRTLSKPYRSHVNNLQRLVSALFHSAQAQGKMPADTYLGLLRGRFGELVVLEHVRAKYQGLGGSRVLDNVVLTINGTQIAYNHKRTVDVGATATEPEEGTFIEVKVSPDRFSPDGCRFLSVIKAECDRINYRALVAGVTLHSNLVFLSSNADLPRSYPTVRWLGAEDLLSLRRVG